MIGEALGRVDHKVSEGEKCLDSRKGVEVRPRLQPRGGIDG